MKTIDWNPEYKADSNNYTAAIGVFDGVHKGHQVIIKTVVQDAEESGGESMVITFDPHPREVLTNKAQVVKQLASPSRKEELFEALGVDVMVRIPFTPSFASLSPQDFIKKVLVDSLQIQTIAVGYNFRFGLHGQGDAEALEALGARHGLKVCIFPALEIDGEIVSSTLVREILKMGDVKQAAHYLGYLYHLEGIVVHGEKRGRALGFPTANIEVDAALMMPALGVYGVWVYHQNKRYPGMANVGLRPTFKDHTKSEVRLEVYILDFDSEIYGELLTIEFVFRVRNEKSFSGPETLAAQLKKDKETIRQVLLE